MGAITKSIIILIVAVLLVLIGHTLSVKSKQISVNAISPVELDQDAVINRLQTALRFKTISYDKRSKMDVKEFQKLHKFIYQSYPYLAKTLKIEIINHMTMLLRWEGKDDSLKPIMVMNHIDVVQAQKVNLPKWEEPPFSANINDGYIYARGAMDTKSSAIASLEAINTLIKNGYQPNRTVYVSLGHDEEIGGGLGNKKVAQLLKSRGVHFEFVMDEGGAIVKGAIPGINVPVAMVGISEKGYMSMILSVDTEAGHSSSPPKETAIGILSKALVKIEDNPARGKLAEPLKQNFEFLAPEMSLPLRFVLSNAWFFEPAIVFGMEQERETSMMVRTTSALTLFHSGVKENILPSRAEATINFRIIPGETVETVTDRIKLLIDDSRINIEFTKSGFINPAPVSNTDAIGFKLIQKTVAQIFRSPKYGDVVVSPYMLGASTDSKHFKPITENIYRFNPMISSKEDMVRIHGIGERIGVDNYVDMIQYFYQFFINLNVEAES